MKLHAFICLLICGSLTPVVAVAAQDNSNHFGAADVFELDTSPAT